MTTGSFTFTVFTPTYNRQGTLHRVYESLLAQTFNDFEWLVVDDGSSDGTGELINRWGEEAPFPIRYFWQENRGKHAAINKGVQEARGALFLIADSDDTFVAEALRIFHEAWLDIDPDTREGFTGVAALCMDQNGKGIGDPFPSDPLDVDAIEMRLRYKVKGEKWGFHRREVMKAFPFPEQGDRFVPEDLVWNRIARCYKTRFINRYLRTYHKDSGTSLTGGGALARASACMVYEENLNYDLRLWPTAPLQFFKIALLYSRYGFHAGRDLFEQWRRLNRHGARLLWSVAFIPGYLISRWDARRGRLPPGDGYLEKIKNKE